MSYPFQMRVNQLKFNQFVVVKDTTKGAVQSEESEEDEYIEDLPPKAKKGHSTISAEAFGLWNKRKEFTPKIIQKTQDQKIRIIDRLQNSFMFSALDDKEKTIVIDAMEEKKFR
jgi:cAMP-dependent protein kinase regulator